jgi:plastocyanin
MRKLFVLMAVPLTLAATSGAGTALAAAAPTHSAKNPVKITGKVNAHGTKDVSAKKFVTLSLEEDDYYISPTFIKVQPGEKITVKIKNDGKATHTFTSSAVSIDKQLSPGSSKKFTLTIPSTGTVFQFHCSFHESMGMQGAFYTGASGSGTNATNSNATNSNATASSATSSSVTSSSVTSSSVTSTTSGGAAPGY